MRTFWKSPFFALSILLVITAAIYVPSLGNEFVSWDDDILIYKNPIVQELSMNSIKQAFSSYDPELYIPLTFLSYQIDHAIGGLDPFLYHLQNLFWHLANVALVFLFLMLLSGKRWVALAAAALFALHPLQTEAIVWASARKDLVSTFFFLASLCTYLLYRQKNRTAFYIGSLILFLLGLLSKVMVIMLPIVLLLIDLREGRRLDRRAWMEKIPFLLLSILFGIIAIVGKERVLESTPFLLSMLMAARSIVFYLVKLIFPVNLSPIYPAPVDLSATDLLPFAGLSIILCGAVWYWRRIPELVFGVLFFFITLLPTFTNFSKGGALFIASDRYAYVPSIGLFFLLAAILTRWSDGKSWRVPISIGFIVMLFIFTTLSYKQSFIWKDSATLYQHAIEVTPWSPVPYNSLGVLMLESGKIEEGMTHLRKAIELDPSYARAHQNLGMAYGMKGMYEEAMMELQHAIELHPKGGKEAKRLEELMRMVGQ